VGHSQGTTQAFAAFSSNAPLARQIKAYAALAPVIQVAHMSNKLMQYIAAFDPIEILKLLGVRDFLGPSILPSPIKQVVEILCKAGNTPLHFDLSLVLTMSFCPFGRSQAMRDGY